MIAVYRLGACPHTQAYAARRTQQGKSKPDIIRCLKRAIAREVHHALTADLADLIAHNRPGPAHTTVILGGNPGHGTLRQRT
jgi:hypothetical protein